MYSRTFHYEWANIEGYQTITAWQGINNGNASFDFETMSTIWATVKNAAGEEVEVNQSGIVAVMFDDDAAMVSNERQKVTTAYSANGDFTSFYYKAKLGLLNDLSQQCVVFYVAD